MEALDGGLERAAVHVRPMVQGDWAAVRAIFAEGIDTGDATFETAPPTWERWDSTHLQAPRLVAVIEGEVCGWAALSPVSDRCAYDGVAEDSVYVASSARGAGVGRALLERLLSAADASGLWTVQAGIFPENTPSVRLHLRCGFRIVGTRERLGRLHGVWRDVLLVERRAP